MIDSRLTGLVPSTALLLAYSIPLLLISILLTQAGTFLILDRSRSFSPSYDVISGSHNTFFYILEGGVGGLAVGFVFGVHLSTFLSLLIPAVSSSASQNPTSFLAVWILSASFTTAIGGRWKYCALAFAGVLGGALMALSLSIILHPSLITRVAFASILTPTFTCMTLIPIVRFQQASLRLATSAAGAFGVVLSIALLARIPAYGDAWERWWQRDRIDWGSRKEKGLSAALFFIFLTGLSCDWFLHWKFGACPDEKWDRHLSAYAINLPDRAGTFRPLRSFWDRIFRRDQSTLSNDKLLPSDRSLRFADPLHPGRQYSRPRLQADMGRKRETVKFKSFDDLESECSSDSDHVVSTSPETVEGIPQQQQQQELNCDEIEKTLASDKNINSIPSDQYQPNMFSQQTSAVLPPRFRSILPPPASVPATPSLTKALGRVTSAQTVAYQSFVTPQDADAVQPGNDGNAGKRYNGFDWESFWKDINMKVRHDRHDQ